MRKVLISIFILFSSLLFSNANQEGSEIYYEDSFNGYSIDTLEIDLSVEELHIEFHNRDSILVYISGYAPEDDITKYLDFGIDNSSFYIESLPKMFSGFTRYSIKVELILPASFIDYYNLKSSTGNIYIDSPIAPMEFKAQSSTGDLYFESIKAKEIAIETSTGDKEIGELITSSLFLKSSTGDSRIGLIEASKGVLKSSTGEIYISSYIGDLDISTSIGDVEIRKFSQGSANIDTSTGRVYMELDESGYNLDISTSTGDIDSSLPIMIIGDIKDNTLKGSINGGGSPIRIKTSTGSVTLRG